MNFNIQKLRIKHTFLKINTNWAMLSHVTQDLEIISWPTSCEPLWFDGKNHFFQFFHRNDKTSEGRWFKLWKKNIWIPLFKASFCSLPPLWPTVQFKTRHGDLDQTSWHPWHTCSTCQCWTNWQVRISNYSQTWL